MTAWNHVTIVGVGLIGGSVGLALRERKLARTVIGTGSSSSTLQTALELGAIDTIVDDSRDAARQADLVIVCAPVAQIVNQVRHLAPYCRPDTLITDAGSTKSRIVEEIEQAVAAWPPAVHFIGSHPLAGNEKTGPRNARADLFLGRVVVITPTPRSSAEKCRELRDFWGQLGAHVVQMPADEHDRAVAATSHLPHLVASAIAGATPAQYVTLTAGGWQDTTRIAAGDPRLWQQIMLANRANLLESLDQFLRLLADWRTALDAADAEELERLLSKAKSIRDAVGN